MTHFEPVATVTETPVFTVIGPTDSPFDPLAIVSLADIEVAFFVIGPPPVTIVAHEELEPSVVRNLPELPVWLGANELNVAAIVFKSHAEPFQTQVLEPSVYKSPTVGLIGKFILLPN